MSVSTALSLTLSLSQQLTLIINVPPSVCAPLILSLSLSVFFSLCLPDSQNPQRMSEEELYSPRGGWFIECRTCCTERQTVAVRAAGACAVCCLTGLCAIFGPLKHRSLADRSETL